MSISFIQFQISLEISSVCSQEKVVFAISLSLAKILFRLKLRRGAVLLFKLYWCG